MFGQDVHPKVGLETPLNSPTLQGGVRPVTSASQLTLRTQTKRARIVRSWFMALLAVVVLLTTAPASASAATGSAPNGTFECFYSASGQRIVRAHLPQATSSYSWEQVWWYAAVYRKNSVGTFDFVGYTFGGDLMTGFATPNGLHTGAIVQGFKWTNQRTGAAPSHGGQLAVTKGTYKVAGYFFWQYGPAAWSGAWAKHWATGNQTCTFGN